MRTVFGDAVADIIGHEEHEVVPVILGFSCRFVGGRLFVRSDGIMRYEDDPFGCLADRRTD